MKIRIRSGTARKNSTTAVAGRLIHEWSDSRPAANTAAEHQGQHGGEGESAQRVEQSVEQEQLDGIV